MKIWLKYLIAVVVGVCAGLVIPPNGIFETISEISINIACYSLGLMIFCSAVVSTFELHEEKRVTRIWFKTILYSVILIILFTLIGVLVSKIFPLTRIPLNADSVSSIDTLPTFKSIIAEIFPTSMLITIVKSNFFLPLLILASLLGIASAFDKVATKPAISFFDSLSKILWRINNYIVEFFPIPLIVIASTRVSNIFKDSKSIIYLSLLSTILIATVFVVFIVIPLLLLVFNRKQNPYKVLLAVLVPALTGFITGNLQSQTGISAKHLKENLSVRRRCGGVSLPLATIFGRAGSALVITICFASILNSYSYLGIGSETQFWLIYSVPLAALFLGANLKVGPVVALVALCAQYGRGFESGYTLLVPIAIPLAMISTFIDSICASCITYVVADKDGYSRMKEVRYFI